MEEDQRMKSTGHEGVIHDLIADPQRDLQSANLQAEVPNEVANQEVNSEVVLLRK